MKIKNIFFNFLKDLSYHLDTDSLSFSLTKWYGIFWAACVRERHLYLLYSPCLPKLRSDIIKVRQASKYVINLIICHNNFILQKIRSENIHILHNKTVTIVNMIFEEKHLTIVF